MRHHYIPQCLLRNFLDSSGKIYGFVKSNPSGGVFATTPKKLMVKKDLYTLLGESGPARQAVEGRLADYNASFTGVKAGDLDATFGWDSTPEQIIDLIDSDKGLNSGSTGVAIEEGLFCPGSVDT